MANPFFGEVMAIGFDFSPAGWSFCQGSIIPIAQNQALFAVIGNIYGGDGFNTMGLPKLNGRIPIGEGQGPGLSDYPLGVTHGYESINLIPSHLPSHTHGKVNADAPRTTGTPANNTWPSSMNVGGNVRTFVDSPGGSDEMSLEAISISGGSDPHENRQPYLAVNYIIAMYGIFPPRN